MDPIEVQGPDGQRYQFPADTPPDVMKQAMAKRYPKPVSTVEDVAKAIPSGLVSGVTGMAGMPGDLNELVGLGAEKVLGPEPKRPPPTNKLEAVLEKMVDWTGLPTSQQTKGAAEKITGPLYEPQTRAGKYARTAAEFAPGVLMGPGTLGQRALTTGTSALGSEAAGQATEGSKWEPYARIAGALAGGVAPSLGARALTPLPIQDPERQALVNTLQGEGVTDLTAGQITGRKGLQYKEATLGGNAAERMATRAGEQFSGAAMGRLGENTARATPEAMTRFFDKIDNAYNGIAARNNLQMDPQFGRDVAAAARDYQGMVPAGQHARVVEDFLNDFVGVAQNNGGLMPGAQYQSWRSRLGRIAQKTADPQLRGALRDMQGALDDAMERSITASGNPADAALMRETNRQYRNYKIMEPAITGAGENAALGIVSPSKLRTSTAQKTGRAYQTGQGDFGELARAGEAIMKPLPNSGTGPRVQASANAALAGALMGGPPGAAAAAGGAWLYPKVAGPALMSRPVQGYLGNQRFANAARQIPESAARAALLQILMGPSRLLPALTNESGQ